MKKIKSLKDLNKYVGMLIDGNKSAVDFSGVELHSDGDGKLRWNGEIVVTGEHVKNVTFNETNGNMTITFQDGKPPLVIRIPHLDIIDDINYDGVTNEIVLVKKDGSEIRVDVSDLIDVYVGSEGANIDIEVEDNEIKAILLEGTISEAHLTTELQARINNMETAIANHTHNYNSLTARPVIKFEQGNVSNGDSYAVNVGAGLYNVEYIVARSGDLSNRRQSGTVKVRGTDVLEMDVFGFEMNVSFTADGNNFVVNNNAGANIDVKLWVSLL